MKESKREKMVLLLLHISPRKMILMNHLQKNTDRQVDWVLDVTAWGEGGINGESE